MKTRILLILLALTFIFSSCEATNAADETLDTSSDTTVTESVTRSISLEYKPVDSMNGEIQLAVTDDQGQPLSPDKVIFESSDYSIATINKQGVLSSLAGGMVSVTATLKDDMSVKDTISVFAPYRVSAPKSSNVVASSQIIDEDFSGMSDFVAKNGFKVIKSTFFSGVPIGLLINFFSKDVYQFSLFKRDKVAEDIVLYDLTGWTNEQVRISETNLDSSNIYSAFCESVDISESLVGKSFDDALLSIEGVVRSAKVKEYCFNEMSDDYEYRIVIRGNCDYVKNHSYYSNGLLTGFGLSVQDLAKLDFESLSENYTYMKTFDEILNITNLQLCLEYRSK